MDAWTSPNSRAFVAITAHFKHNGDPVSLLLDIVEVAWSHLGFNLAAALAKILEEFGICDKVRGLRYQKKYKPYLEFDFADPCRDLR